MNMIYDNMIYDRVGDDLVDVHYKPDKAELFRAIAEEMHNMYCEKNTAYGDSFGASYEKYGAMSALTRISDKFNRYENIVLNSADTNDEPLRDTLMDMASYCVMTLIEMDREACRNENASND